MGEGITIETKTGTTGSLKSMRMFLREYNVPFRIRFLMQPLSFHDSVLNIPLYALEALPNLLEQLLSDKKVTG